MGTAFDMGRKSFIAGRFTHPYRKETILAKEWQRGWDRAYFDQQKNPVFKYSDADIEDQYYSKKAEEWASYLEEKKLNYLD